MNLYLTKRELGIEFETQIHNLLKTTCQTVLREKDVINKYGKISSAIDHLLYENTPSSDIIVIQDKWRESSQQLSEINHFIHSVQHIERFEKKYVKAAIYLSRKKISSGAKLSIDTENQIKHRYYNIYDDDMNIAQFKLTQMLYYLNIYTYEDDGSVIMLDYNNII
jgi:hypothetical protein